MKRHSDTGHVDERFDDPRLSAYALGELEGAERAELERRLAEDPELAAFVEELGETARLVAGELAAEEAPELEPAQRAAIESASRGRSGRSWGPVRIATLGLSGIAAAAVATVGVWGGIHMLSEGDLTGFRYDLGTGADQAPPAESQELARAQAAPQGLGYTGGEQTDVRLSYSALDPAAAAAPEAVGETRARRFGGRAANRPNALALRPAGSEDETLLRDGGLEGDREAYAYIAENPFVRVADDPLSTFSIDVDTASYANVRRFLNQGQLPPADAVRIEELVNYFAYGYPEPSGEDPFSVSTEVVPCPWKPGHLLVRIGLKGREVHPFERKPANLVFLLDVSGSMNNPAKLPLLKRSMRMLVESLNRDDTVAVVVYAGASGLVLEPTPATSGAAILEALERLQAGGSTNGGAGIELAYDVARRNFREGGINRVVLCTDGDFNVGTTSDGELVRLIEEKAKTGVFLSVLGFGQGNLQDSKMEQLADKGNGNYSYIDGLNEARKVLVNELGGTLDTIAKDVKIQVEFNPARVAGFRQIGYENRKLAHQDFADDTKDAGEIGAGHRVTALYEVVPAGVEVPAAGAEVELAYQEPTRLSERARSGELLTVKLRFKEPDGEKSRERSFAVAATPTAPSADTQHAAAVALFGMLLRGSEHAGDGGFEQVFELCQAGMAGDPFGYRAEFAQLVQRAIPLVKNR